ncbi:hypothetical protein ACQJBY_059382 [Aegilops geniculata]
MWCGRRFKITSESYFNCNAMGKEARSTRNTHYVNRMSVLSWCGVRAGLVHEGGANCTRLFLFPGGCRRCSSPTLNSVKRGCCLADGGGRRSVFKRGVFLYFCAFSPGRRGTPNDNYFGTEGVLLMFSMKVTRDLPLFFF